MPTYEYRCNACTREFEYQQKMSDPDLVRCEACGEDKLERLISWTSVRSTSWQEALYSSNPRAAMKGMTAIDRGRSQRFTGAEPVDSTAPCSDAGASATTDEVGGDESGAQ